MDTAPSPRDAHQATAIARQTMSPFCPGRTLYDCPSPNAAEWRREIEAMLAAGKSAPEIQAVLAQRAELDLSGSPAHEASYVWPIIALVLAVLGLVFVFHRLRPRGKLAPPPPPSGPVPGPETNLDARLDEELEEVR